MHFREDKASGNMLSVLGLGGMRFPRDKAESERLILAAIEGGVNLIDTAYIYPGSEKLIGEVLAKHNKRESVYIATKLPLMALKSPADCDRYFRESCNRLRTDYIDYYMLHNMTDFAQWERLREIGVADWLTAQKDAGRVRNIGFSYHGSYDEYMKILPSYPWGFCMLQYNYYDENYQAGRRGVLAAYEAGVSVFVMEPLLGGRLAANLPKAAAEIFLRADESKLPADWALQWLWSDPGVTVVVSGMTSTDTVMKNLSTAEKYSQQGGAGAFTQVYSQVGEVFRKAYRINCTGCNYCLPCPVGINIPACLTAYNARYVQGLITGMALYMTSTAAVRAENLSPRKCNNCGKCEKACPQKLPIRKDLKRVARKMEPWYFRAAMAVVRKFLR